MNRIRRALPLLLALLLLLPACSPTPPADDFAYAAAPFTASIRGTYTPADGEPRPIAATVAMGEPLSGGSPTDRSVTLTFTQPSTLEGITVSAVYETGPQGETTRTVTFSAPSAYGEVKATAQAEEFDGFLRFAEALLPLGDTAAVSPVAEDGTHTVTRRTADGTWEAVYLFSEEYALPLRVTVTTAEETLELVINS